MTWLLAGMLIGWYPLVDIISLIRSSSLAEVLGWLTLVLLVILIPWMIPPARALCESPSLVES